jgi:hypothetical protein
MGNLVIIGPTSSGKTTYLAGLAYWPKRQEALRKASLFDVYSVNEDAENLEKQAKNVILPQDSFEGTNIVNLSEMPQYHFQIDIKRKLFKKPEIINLVVRDSAGELFDNLIDGKIKVEHEEIYEDFFRKDVIGCLILLSEWHLENDEEYSSGIRNLIELLEEFNRINDLRLAIAMSKCERGELWPCRLEPEIDIFTYRLPQTKKILEASNIPRHNLRYFAISTFGVLERNDPRPNRIYEPGLQKYSVLRKPTKWRPYNIISPLYWLSTGKRMLKNA